MINISAHSAQAIAAELKIPQRRARYHDKSRVRLADVKGWVLARTGLNNSKEVGRALKKLGIKIDLRLTVSWVYINLYLVYEIEAPTKARRSLPELEKASHNELLVGSRVNLINLPARLAYLEAMSPFNIREVAPDRTKAFLDYVSVPIALENLQLVS